MNFSFDSVSPLLFEALSQLVLDVLTKPLEREWSIQGFGMLRTYLNQDLRLHVWSPRGRVENVSDIHDHPWHFDSIVIRGSILNERYARTGTHESNLRAVTHHEGSIICGPSPEVKGATNVTRVELYRFQSTVYKTGESYSMNADELHRSHPARGTVTLIRRRRAQKHPDKALVYWPLGTEWVSAEPRDATREERDAIIGDALECWHHWPKVEGT